MAVNIKEILAADKEHRQALQEILKLDSDAVVVVCTADVQAQSIMRVYEVGAAHLVKKPPTKDKIFEALTKFDK